MRWKLTAILEMTFDIFTVKKSIFLMGKTMIAWLTEGLKGGA
jgi:hypothetical protein